MPDRSTTSANVEAHLRARAPAVTLRCANSEQLGRLYARNLKVGRMVLPAGVTDERGAVHVRVILPGGKAILLAATVTQINPASDSLLRVIFATLSAEQVREVEGRLPHTPHGTPIARFDGDTDDGRLEGLFGRVFGPKTP